MAEKGLFIDIQGEVSKKLLRSIEKLKEKLNGLSRSAARYSATAKAAGQDQLGRNLDNLSRQVKGTANEMEINFARISDAAERGRRVTGENIDHLAEDIRKGNAKIKKLQAPTAKKIPEEPREVEKAGAPKPEELRLRNELYQEYTKHLGQSRQAQKEAARRADQLTDSVTRTYRAMGETGALREGHETLEAYTGRVNANRLAQLDLHKQLKMTRNGFSDVDDEAAKALDLDYEQVDALTGKFSKLDDRIKKLDSSFVGLRKQFKEDLDITSPKSINTFKRSITDIRSQVRKLRPEMEEAYGTDVVENYLKQLDEQEAKLKDTQSSYKALQGQRQQWQKLNQQVAEGYEAADARSEEYWNEYKKRVAEGYSYADAEAQAYWDNFYKRMKKLQGEDFSILSREQLKQRRTEVSNLSKQLYKLQNSIPSEKFQEYENILQSTGDSIDSYNQATRDEAKAARAAAADEEKRTASMNSLRQTIDDINKTPFKAIPEGQLPERLKQIRRLNAQLYKLYQNGEITHEEWKKQADILQVNDKRLSHLLATNEEYNRTGHRTTNVITRLMRRFHRFSRILIQQVQLWGILGGIIVGIQAAYAGLATWATKAAASLGENAEKLSMSTQALSEFQAAATMTGTSVEDLNEALESLNDTVIDALKGKSKAADAFEALGIQFDTLVNKGNDTEAMFELVMNRLDELDSSAKELSLAKDIFGEGPASTLINLTGNLEEARNAMKQFDITMSKEGVRAAENFWNKMRGLWLVIKRQFISAAVEASDVMSKFVDQLLVAAAQGNIFEGTIVPAVKSTVGILKSLITMMRGLYQVIHALYEAWNYLLIPIKALMGYMLVSYFRQLAAGIWTYVTAMRAATTVTERLSIALKGLLRATGYYLLIEGIIRIVHWLGKAQEVAKETGLTFKQAFRAVIQDAVEGTLTTIKNKAPKIGAAFIKGFFRGMLDHPWIGLFLRDPISFMIRNKMGLLKKQAGEAGEEVGKAFQDNVMERFRKWKEKDAFKGMGEGFKNIFEGGTQGAKKSRMEMLKTAEVVEGASQDITDSIQQMAKEGRTEDVEEWLPFAKEEIVNKIGKVVSRIQTYKEEIQRVQRLPGPYGDVPDEVLEKLHKLQLRHEKLRQEYEKLSDLPVQAEMNKFEEQFDNSMQRAELKFKEGSKELRQHQKQILTDQIKSYQDLLKEHPDMTEQMRREVVNSMLKTQNKLNDIEGEGLQARIKSIQQTAEQNIQTAQNERKERIQELEKLAAQGEISEDELAKKRIEIQKQGSQDELQIQENKFQKIQDLLGKHIQTVVDKYGKNSDEVQAYREAKQAEIEAEQNLTDKTIQEINKRKARQKQALQDEIDLAQQRKGTATAGQLEEQTRYTGAGAETVGQSAAQTAKTNYEAAKEYQQKRLDLYDQQLQYARKYYGEESKEYKQLQLKKEQYLKKSNANLAKLQDQYRREQIKENGSMWQKMQLGAQNYADEVNNNLYSISSATKELGNTIQSSLTNSLAGFIKRTKTAEEAFKGFVKSVLSSMAEMLASAIAQDFMRFMLSGMGSSKSGGGMTGPPQAGTGTQSSGSGWGQVAAQFIMAALSSSGHTGGIVGKDFGVKLDSINSSIASAMMPHRHDGMRSDEYAAVLQQGEEVRTREQSSREQKQKQPNQMVVNNNITVQAPEGKVSDKSAYQIKKNAAKGLQQAMAKQQRE